MLFVQQESTVQLLKHYTIIISGCVHHICTISVQFFATCNACYVIWLLTCSIHIHRAHKYRCSCQTYMWAPITYRFQFSLHKEMECVSLTFSWLNWEKESWSWFGWWLFSTSKSLWINIRTVWPPNYDERIEKGILPLIQILISQCLTSRIFN
jgi:hypothetical protein